MPVTTAQLANVYNQAHSSKQGRTINSGTYRVQLNGLLLRHAAATVANPERYFLINNLPVGMGGGGGGVAIGSINAQTVVNLFNQHEDLTYGGGANDYTTAKTDATWQHMYHRQNRQLLFRNPANNEALAGPAIPSYPCHYCGIILPESLIQIDHQLPKGGNHQGAAVLKTLHSLNGGLTTAAAHGTKNTQTVNIAANNVGALNRIPVKGYAFGQAWASPALPLGGAKGNRYTMTPAGNTFLTLAIMVFGQTRFVRECVNSFLNLVPACASCNGTGGKGNLVHAY